MVALLLISLAVLVYVFVGYPVLLKVLVSIRGPRRVRSADSTPSLSLVISAYNEADVMRRKLENAVELAYPDHAREIVVISDASSDETDAIVREFEHRGVRLERQPQRRGKTAGLNRTVPTLGGDIVVFSDANAMYEPDALLKLVRNFADPDVGCVTGEARYTSGGRRASEVGERVYWDYEILIKRLETALGSMVGGDGAIYAIRRSLWRTLPENAINDFLNPLQIVEAGWRCVYEPEAICYEEPGGAIRTEYRRRVRIVSRSWRAVFQARGVLNPFRVGLFTWSLVSHKMLRWLSGMFAAAVALSGLLGLLRAFDSEPRLTLIVLAAAATGVLATRIGRRLVAMLAYFATIYAASIVGVFKGSMGSVSGVWTTPRQHDVGGPPEGRLVPVGLLLHAGAVVTVVIVGVLFWSMPTVAFAKNLFWMSIGVLVYVYVGYPLLLAAIRLVGRRAVQRRPIEPRVCVFIAANDEQAVIGAKLQNTLALDYPPDRLEVVVASDGSVDGTNEIVRSFAPRVRLLEFVPRRGKIATINDGVGAVTSDIIVFSDANTFLERDAVRALVKNFADQHVGAVSGDVALIGERASLGRSEDLYYRYERWMQRAESEVGSMIGADGALYAIRRVLFVPPPSDTILDDMAIPMAVIRAGKRVVYEGEARAFEQGAETALEEFARKSRVIAGAAQFMRRRDSSIPLAASQVILSLVSHKALRWLSPVFAAATLLASVALAGESRLYSTALTAQLALVGLGLAGCVPALRTLGIVAVAHYFCLVQAAAAVGFLRGLSGRQSVLWKRFDRAHAAAPGVHA
jgi:cellulose synthase/poly-beta-1,6-N-acetylglucosamine synthase-like glycosyltransferase